MKIKINDTIPDDMEFFHMSKKGPETINSNTLFSENKVIFDKLLDYKIIININFMVL